MMPPEGDTYEKKLRKGKIVHILAVMLPGKTFLATRPIADIGTFLRV